LYHEADAPLPPEARAGQGIHHPIFAHKLQEKAQRLGVEAVYRHSSDGNSPPPQVEMLEFFRRHLTAPP
jgi:hypothetical protein